MHANTHDRRVPHVARDSFIDKAQDLCKDIEDLARSAPDAASEQMQELKAVARDLWKKGYDGVIEAPRTVKNVVVGNPVASLLTLTGVGLFAWWMFSRNRSA